MATDPKKSKIGNPKSNGSRRNPTPTTTGRKIAGNRQTPRTETDTETIPPRETRTRETETMPPRETRTRAREEAEAVGAVGGEEEADAEEETDVAEDPNPVEDAGGGPTGARAPKTARL